MKEVKKEFLIFLTGVIVIAVGLTVCVREAQSQNIFKTNYAPEAIQTPQTNQTGFLPDICTLDVVDCTGRSLRQDGSGGSGTPTPATNSKAVLREVTAYSSREGETDDTPCIAADGSDICARHAQGEFLCATNAFPLGTRITVEHFGTCVVADRMNSRYQNRVDVYMGMDTEMALRFGKQTLYVTPL